MAPKVVQVGSPLTEDERKAARAARFAADAAKPAPAPPVRKFAHPGGKLTSNKDEARAKFLARKGRESRTADDDQAVAVAAPAQGLEAAQGVERVDKLFVGNMAYSMTSAALGKLFTNAGFDVVGSKVVADRGSGRSKGFGFVTFGNAVQAREAERSFAGTSLDGRILTVRPAEQRGTKAAAMSNDKASKPQGMRGSGWGSSWCSPVDDENDGGDAAADGGKQAPAAAPPRGAPGGASSSSSSEEAVSAAVLNAEKPLEEASAVSCEAVTLWKIATAEDAAKWRASGVLSGSALDASDGFAHYSNATQVKKVAALFFKGQAATLLSIEPEHQPRGATWTTQIPTDAAAAALPLGASLVHALEDGCIHVYAAQPWAFDTVTATFDLPFDADKDAHAFPPECELRQGPKPLSIGGFTINY